MPIKRMLDLLLPRERRFISMLASQADLVLNASEEFDVFITHYNKLSGEDRADKRNKIKEIEKKGDFSLGELHDGLHETFITPLDREDILSIAQGMEAVLDLINETTAKVVMYKVESMPQGMAQFSHRIRGCCVVLKQSMHNLKDYGETKKSMASIAEIESEADRLFQEAMGNLFASQQDARELIKFKDLYSSVEETIDSCKRVGTIVERTVLKHA